MKYKQEKRKEKNLLRAQTTMSLFGPSLLRGCVICGHLGLLWRLLAWEWAWEWWVLTVVVVEGRWEWEAVVVMVVVVDRAGIVDAVWRC